MHEHLPSDPVISAWARLMRAQRKALSHVESRLKSADLPPLSWYDALLEIERADAEGMRPVELERKMLLAQHNVSRLLDRLHAAGYVERRDCPEDGRGRMLHMTEAGRMVRRRMWPVYAAAIQEALGAKLTSEEAERLAALLQKI